jgi:hypothetical protein
MLRPVRPILVVAAVTILLAKAVPAAKHPYYAAVYPPAGMPQRLAALLPPGHYRILSDWIYNNAPVRADGNYAIERMMDNWLAAGYLSPNDIATCATFYHGEPDLTLVMDPAHEQWMKDRLIDNPAFHLQQMASFDEWNGVSIWTVHRSGDPGPCK